MSSVFHRVRFIGVASLTMMLLHSCTKDKLTDCYDVQTTASFNLNGTESGVLEEAAWLRSGTLNSLNFNHQFENGNEYTVVVIFSGDSIGNYPLLDINAANRASIFGPGINGTVFNDTIEPGVLTITNFENEPGCLSGYYTFSADTTIVSGDFQSLRPY